MFLTITQLRAQLHAVIADKKAQGHVVEGLEAELDRLPDSYDALFRFAERLAALPLRDDWPYVEPSDWPGILAECDAARPLGALDALDPGDLAARAEAGFLGSVCGCILGKPLEINPTLAELRAALETLGEWPLRDYISERMAAALGRPLHPSWTETTREHICYVAPDDDLNYTVIGLLLLEQHGLAWTKRDLRDLWLRSLPPGWTFGPERTLLTRAALNSYRESGREAEEEMEDWVTLLNPKDEYCGAMIRVDAYGYACLGRPALAAELAWRDASWTHRRTGIYGAMWLAAALAAAAVERDPLRVFETALGFVPRHSRFYAIVSDALEDVAQASDWLDGYERIHQKYGEYAHCRIYQESGSLINTLRFAESVGDGIGKQVSQGMDTDSYGARAGSLLGVFLGPGHLEPRWLAPFQDDFRTAVAAFPERSLAALAKRMGALPARVAAEMER